MMSLRCTYNILLCSCFRHSYGVFYRLAALNEEPARAKEEYTKNYTLSELNKKLTVEEHIYLFRHEVFGGERVEDQPPIEEPMMPPRAGGGESIVSMPLPSTRGHPVDELVSNLITEEGEEVFIMPLRVTRKMVYPDNRARLKRKALKKLRKGR